MTIQEAELMIGKEVEVMTLEEIRKIGFVDEYDDKRIREKKYGYFHIVSDLPIAGKKGVLRKILGRDWGGAYLRINSPQKNGVTDWEIPPSFVRLPIDYTDLNEIEE